MICRSYPQYIPQKTVQNNKGNWIVDPQTHSNQISKALADRTFIGIDFGTATSVVSIIAEQKPNLWQVQTLGLEQPGEDGGVITHYLVNSVLARSKQGNRLLFGKDAYRMRSTLKEGMTVFSSFKMKLGIDFVYRNTLLRGDDQLPAIENAKAATTTFFGFLVRAIHQQIEKLGLPEKVCFALTVPASFEANQRRDILECMKAATGMEMSDNCLIDEPNAAFMSFLNNIVRNSSPAKNQLLGKISQKATNILVYDFGAGTCDVSILEISLLENRQFSSRNRAISKFTELGGDDIDRAIARKILWPQMEPANEQECPLFMQVDEAIIPRLQPTAENLKISAIKWLHERKVDTLKKLRATKREPFVDHPIEKFTVKSGPEEKISLELGKPTMSLQQLADVLEDFVGDPDLASCHVFDPVEDALGKAGMEADHLDFVLFIGGSSENQFVQKSIMHNLPDTVQSLLPEDLRKHVSIGASLHSLGYHALGHELVCPITSEPICVITKGGVLKTLIPASTKVPTQEKIREILYPQDDGQKIVELPICVGNQNKLLGLLKITASRKAGFGKNDQIEVVASINHEKLLDIEVYCAGKKQAFALLNPLSNQELSKSQADMLETKQQYNLEVYKNKRPTKTTVLRYAKLAENARDYQTAVDMYKTHERLDDCADHATRICWLYAQIDNSRQSHLWAKKAYKRDRNHVTAHNLSINEPEPDKKKRLLQQAIEMNADDYQSQLSLGALLDKQGDAKGKAMIQQVMEKLLPRLENDLIESSDCRTLMMAAKFMGRDDIAKQAETRLKNLNYTQSLEEEMEDVAYIEEHLADSLCQLIPGK